MAGILITRDVKKVELLKHRGPSMYGYHRHGFYISQFLKLEKEPPKYGSLRSGGLLLFDGEIFNHPEKYLSSREYLKDLFDNSDSIEDIKMAANYWDGYWAIVYISENGFMYCFTDPLGIKQLYFNDRAEICSEIRPLIGRRGFDPFYKSTVYKWGYNTDDSTPWKGVKRIMPNKMYTFASGLLQNIHAYPYYDWNRKRPYKPLREAIVDATNKRIPQGEFAVLVSGGLDSAIVAKILMDAEARVTFYTVENDETEYAELLAAELGFRLRYLDFDVDDDIEETFRFNETPIDLGSVLPQHRLLKSIPEDIVMTGDGADELFGGYDRAKEYDSQQSDIFEELPFYHLPRLDRAAGRFGIDLRSPFLSQDIVKYALAIPYKDRIGKIILKNAFRRDLPQEIVDREKVPLKNPEIRENKNQYKKRIFELFYKTNSI